MIERTNHVYKAMKRIITSTEDNEHEISAFQGDAHDPLNVENIDQNAGEDAAELKLTKDQRSVLDAIENSMKNNNQMLFIVHGGAGVGKSTVMQKFKSSIEIGGRIMKIKETIEIGGKKVLVVCPTGISATLIEGGATFHHTFNHKTKNVTAQMIRDTFTSSVEFIIIDEVSMITSDFIVMMDEKLRQVYDPFKVFGGKRVILSGDFLQMKAFDHYSSLNFPLHQGQIFGP